MRRVPALLSLITVLAAPAVAQPFVHQILVGPPPPCAACPPPAICPDRPIPLAIAGLLPNSCYRFERLELLPSRLMSPMPAPPIVRAVFAVNDCLGLPCVNEPHRFAATALLPPLPRGEYRLTVEEVQVSWCDSTRMIDSMHVETVPFRVAERCSLPPADACYLRGWSRGAPNSECDAQVGAGTPGRVRLKLLTGTAIGGMQGRFSLEPNALRISQVRPVGIASRMRLAWQPTENGASFVMFSDSGRTFTSPCSHPARCAPGADSTIADDVIEITVEPRTSAPVPALTKLDVHELLLSDSLGREVSACPTFAPVPPARICAGRSCDFNADGHADVRDLVLMARCVVGAGPCPDSAAGRFDCDRDRRLTVDDVLCCARTILRGSLPDSVPARTAPGLSVASGEPAIGFDALTLPVRISGADLVGSARLRFAYPDGRFAGASVEVVGAASEWLALAEAEAGELVVGLVALTPAASRPGALELRVRLEAAAGSSPSPDVQLAGAEFVAEDGAVLSPSPPMPPITATGRIVLTPARPNPFGTLARFGVRLMAETEAHVGVFDPSGREVRTLHRGRLAAGEHDFAWDGLLANGSRATDGLYFCRVSGAGESVARRVVLVRAR